MNRLNYFHKCQRKLTHSSFGGKTFPLHRNTIYNPKPGSLRATGSYQPGVQSQVKGIGKIPTALVSSYQADQIVVAQSQLT